MITETTREIEFLCVPWLMENGKIRPERGTWTLPPAELKQLREKVHGILACPNCDAVMMLAPLPTDEINKEHQTGTLIRKDVRCKCGLLYTAKLIDWDKRRLYCVVFEVPRGKGTRMMKEYLHAESREQAIYTFSQGHLDHPYKLVDAAPVFGYFVDEKKDKEGNSLTVD